ncbi:MAG: histidinol-phosphatase [Oscillospiraceae bacterium]|nr:histidinol-phosphatase [Oscillospiraceae bacterium]
MLVNYHTHTWRCNHAEPDERAYIESAIAAGVKVLGFSDHTPYPFPPEHVSWFRMSVEEAPRYFDLIRKLRDEYKDRIEIHVGVEAEYYPAYFPAMLELLRENGCEYMLLGQHFLFNEEKPEYGSAAATNDPAMLRQYVDQTIEGMATGLFTYLAHPDLIRFTGDEATYRLHMRRLCCAAKELDVPLEMNLLGFRENRHYPTRAFWELAAEEGNRTVLGWDAHTAASFGWTELEKRGRRLLADVGLTPEERVPLRSIMG